MAKYITLPFRKKHCDDSYCIFTTNTTSHQPASSLQPSIADFTKSKIVPKSGQLWQNAGTDVWSSASYVAVITTKRKKENWVRSRRNIWNLKLQRATLAHTKPINVPNTYGNHLHRHNHAQSQWSNAGIQGAEIMAPSRKKTSKR